jgi:hypothetical protein
VKLFENTSKCPKHWSRFIYYCGAILFFRLKTIIHSIIGLIEEKREGKISGMQVRGEGGVFVYQKMK